MNLRISAPGGVIFDGSVDLVTLPTYAGEISILPGHQPLTSVIKAGVVSFVTQEELDDDFTIADGKVQVSVSKGMLLVDGTSIVVTTSAATTSPSETEEVLQKMKEEMASDLEKIRDDGNAEELEKALENMEKIQADIQLVKLKNLG